LLEIGENTEAAEQFQQAKILDGNDQDGIFYDFGAQLASASMEIPAPEYVRGDFFTINGIRKRVLFEHPDSRISFNTNLPDNSILAFDIATSPDSWGSEGDGNGFDVLVISYGKEEKIFSTYIDPKHNVDEQRWIPYEVDLSKYAGQDVTIIFQTNAGPIGDNRFDWAGWGNPRLLVR
jgi:hypothetical protein